MTSRTEAEQFERVCTRIFPSAEAAARELAAEVAGLIRQRATEGKSVVLGLATGSTPVDLFRECIRLHREGGLSFANVVTFNLDEYYGLEPDHRESYHRFMREQLFDHIDLPQSQWHGPSRAHRRRVCQPRCCSGMRTFASCSIPPPPPCLPAAGIPDWWARSNGRRA